MYPVGGGGGGYGYPPNPSGYPPQPQHPPYGAPQPQSSSIGFESLTGPPGGGGSAYPPAPAPYSTPSFSSMAYAATAFQGHTHGGAPSQPTYGGATVQPPYGGQPAQPPYGGPPAQPPYGGPPAQQPSFGGMAYAANAAMAFRPPTNYPPQQPYGGATPAQPPYGGAPQQHPPYGAPTAQPYTTSQQHYGGAPTQQMSNLHMGPSTAPAQPPSRPTPPSRPAPPSTTQTRNVGNIPMEPPTQGTIKDASNFNAQSDAEILRKAMKGIGTDEKAITMVIACRSNNQRQKIKLEFATMYGKDLIKELKSELSGNYESTVLELLMKPEEYDAYQCYNAISGIGTDEMCLIEILCSRSNSDIRALREAYHRMYKRDLEKDVIGDTSGHFGRLLVSLVQGGRTENEPLDHKKAAEDARALYEAGEARWGTDESRFNVILASRSFPQLRLMFDEYEKISRRTLEKAISSEMSGDLKDGMISIVKCARDRPAFFAERLHWSMKGLGTDDKTLIRTMVSRCEVDMVQIKHAFQHKYSKTLESYIKDDCSGDYKKILIQLCNGN